VLQGSMLNSPPHCAGSPPSTSSPMTLPQAAAQRQLKHRRQIDVQVFSCGNGLWEVDAVLTDTKTRVAHMIDGPRLPGRPIHDMLLRLVVNEQLEIVEAGSETRWMPYTGTCNDHNDVYGALVGLNLLQNFRQALRQKLGGVLGCTHITELAQTLPTAVVQAFVGEVIDTRGTADGAKQPFQIDRCHALRSDGEIVRLQHPRWYRAPAAGAIPPLDPNYRPLSEEPP
jgi:Protein of unknown function (DUF2889)